MKEVKATSIHDRSGNYLTEEQRIPKRWTKYYSELYNHRTSGNPSVLNCPQTETEDEHPTVHKEVEAAVQSLKKGKSTGVDNIPAEPVQAGGEAVITVSHDSLQQENGQTRGSSTWSSHFPRKVTCSSARATEQSALAGIQAKSYLRSY